MTWCPLPDVYLGLSPLARGTRGDNDSEYQIYRFIPAGAGNTASTVSPWYARTVYPRWCGEHAFVGGVINITTGLSPLVRGTLHSYCGRLSEVRFIPAGAGNTCICGSANQKQPVYPRWRGEHAETSHPGRPPERFIPARAGNTPWSRTVWGWIPVYPRSRGEHSSSFFKELKRDGLSPLARGTHYG